MPTRRQFNMGLAATLLSMPLLAADGPQGVFVAVGYGGRRMFSSDGLNWTIAEEWSQPGGDDSNNLMSIVFAKGKFVAVGGGGAGKTGGGHILVSADGKTWRHTLKTPNRVNPVVFGDDLFIAGGPNKTLLLSADAETWQPGAKLDAKEATHFRHGAFGNGTFIFTGNHGGNGPPYWCATTKDGKSVASLRVDLPNIQSLAFGAGRFVIVGHDGTRLSSVDGKDWDAHNDDAKAKYDWALWIGTEFLAGGAAGVHASPDGRTWTRTNRKITGHPLWSDGKRIISTGWPGKMFFSPDGQAFQKSPPLTDNGINKVAHGIIAGQ